ncbi:uncharacterized protein LOC141906305 [Tubulanus polymorphus]|uniref:uncharacterized protein LOC141906305 n=1 Tax=Tubulanus polymorphus TaxID=672921 RepID=UPI003DA3C0B9
MAVLFRRFSLMLVFIFWRRVDSRIIIHGLLPLSGSKSQQGNAELLGMQLAWNKSQQYVLDRDVVFSYTDTKCSADVEKSVLKSSLRSSADMVVLIGGDCESGARTKKHFLNQGLLPQILIKDSIIRLPDSVYNIYPTADPRHSAVAELIQELNWNKVVLVTSQQQLNYQGSQLLRKNLEENNIKVIMEIIKSKNSETSSILKASTTHSVMGVYYDFLHLTESKSDILNLGLPDNDSVKVDFRMETSSLALFVILTSLATLLMAYSIAILVYIILNRDHKFIKMTSPNLNVIILSGSVLACLYVILRGCEISSQSAYSSKRLLWAARYILPISSSMFYGTCLLKVWRVYVIFRNLSRNGKITQDLVLLAVILIFVVLDIILVSIWSFGDTPECQTRNIAWLYKSDTGTDYIYRHEQCWSNIRALWVVLFYAYKGAILAACMYFAWHTRHVTLPSMQDAPYVYLVMYNVVLSGVLLVPTMLISSAEETVSYGVTGLAILVLTASNTSVLFIPKILHHRRILKGAQNGDERLKFSESLRKTQDAKDKSSSFLRKIFGGSKKETDSWQEALVNEIENLKQTIKQKDVTIRELNDRLYVYGADKFQSYIRGDNRRQSGRQATVSGKLQINPVNVDVIVHSQTDGAHPGDVIETDLTRHLDDKIPNGHIPPGEDLDPAQVRAHFTNIHARANMAYVRSLEDVNLDDSAIDNALDGSDISDHYRYTHHVRPGYYDNRYNNVRAKTTPQNSSSPPYHSTISSDDSGIHTVYNGMSSYTPDTSTTPAGYNESRPQFTRQKRQYTLNYSPEQLDNDDDIIV